jgi:hypothetical protein
MPELTHKFWNYHKFMVTDSGDADDNNYFISFLIMFL